MIGVFFPWLTGLRVISASSAAVYTGLIPVSAVACAAVLLGEEIGWPHLAGMAVVIVAVVLVSRPSRSTPVEPRTRRSSSCPESAPDPQTPD